MTSSRLRLAAARVLARGRTESFWCFLTSLIFLQTWTRKGASENSVSPISSALSILPAQSAQCGGKSSGRTSSHDFNSLPCFLLFPLPDDCASAFAEITSCRGSLLSSFTPILPITLSYSTLSSATTLRSTEVAGIAAFTVVPCAHFKALRSTGPGRGPPLLR